MQIDVDALVALADSFGQPEEGISAEMFIERLVDYVLVRDAAEADRLACALGRAHLTRGELGDAA